MTETPRSYWKKHEETKRMEVHVAREFANETARAGVRLFRMYLGHSWFLQLVLLANDDDVNCEQNS